MAEDKNSPRDTIGMPDFNKNKPLQGEGNQKYGDPRGNVDDNKQGHNPVGGARNTTRIDSRVGSINPAVTTMPSIVPGLR